MRRTRKRWTPGRWTVAGLLVSLILSFAVAWPALSQSLSLKQILSGRGVPSTLEAKELSADYRVVTVGQNDELTVLQMRMMGWNAVNAVGGAYYTKGETVKAGETTYLIAYRVVEDPAEVRRRMQAPDPEDNPSAPRKLGPHEKVTLSLINLRTAGSLTDVRPFDPAKEVQTEAEYQTELAERGNRNSRRNLRQVGLSIMQYLQDYDEVFPPMNSATSFQQIQQSMGAGVTRSTPVQVRLFPYARTKDIFRHPVTKEIYRFNLSLSYKVVSAIERPAEIAMVYEGSAAADGTRAVAFADGHMQRVREDEWARIKKRSGIVPGVVPPKPKPLDKLAQANRASERNLRQIGLALRQYVQDYDETLPPMVPATSFKQIQQASANNGATEETPVHARLQPYTRNAEVFRHPVTKEIYRPNQSLSFRNESSFERIAETILFYEASVARDGTRAAVFADGHVSRMKPDAWERFRKISGIPSPRVTKAKSAQSSRRRRSRAGPAGRRTRARRTTFNRARR